MKTFKSVIMVKFPKQVVWEAIRDRLPEMVQHLDDVASITQKSRKELDHGILRLVNIWKADIKIPSALLAVIDPDSLGWTDTAEWITQNNKCHWTIEPHFLPGLAKCSGTTHYEPAIGGRGTRITFEGELEINAKNIPGLPAFMEATASKTMETLIISLIPKNFRKVTDALSELLEQKKLSTGAEETV